MDTENKVKESPLEKAKRLKAEKESRDQAQVEAESQKQAEAAAKAEKLGALNTQKQGLENQLNEINSKVETSRGEAHETRDIMKEAGLNKDEEFKGEYDTTISEVAGNLNELRNERNRIKAELEQINSNIENFEVNEVIAEGKEATQVAVETVKQENEQAIAQVENYSGAEVEEIKAAEGVVAETNQEVNQVVENSEASVGKIVNLKDFLSNKKEELKTMVVEKEKNEQNVKTVRNESNEKFQQIVESKTNLMKELASERDVYEGKKLYYSLKNDLGGMKKTIGEDLERKFMLNKLSDEVNQEYKKMQEDVNAASKQEVFKNISQSRLHITDVGGEAGGLRGENHEQFIKTHIDEDYQPEGQIKIRQEAIKEGIGNQWFYKKFGKTNINNPLDLANDIIKNREYKHTDLEYYNSAIDSEDRNRFIWADDKVYGPDRKLQGMAMAALESNDVETAAKVLAMAQAIKEPTARVSEQIANTISKMDESKQKAFIQLFEAENEKQKKEQPEAGNGDEKKMTGGD